MLKLKILKNQKGISNIELIPVLLVFALLFNYMLGFFGVIHSGIMNSIAARNYTMETFRNRANLVYLRDIPLLGSNSVSPDLQNARYSRGNYRFHGIIAEGHGDAQDEWPVTRRAIKFTDINNTADTAGVAADHLLSRQVTDPGAASKVFTGHTLGDSRDGLSPVWLQTLYGICLNSTCVGQ